MAKTVVLDDYTVEALEKYRKVYEKRLGLIVENPVVKSDAELIHLAIISEICFIEDSIRCHEKINEYKNSRKEE